MSVHVSAQVWDLALASTQKFILIKLADYADRDGANVWPSVARIAHECCLSERTVQTALRELLGLGLLEVSREAANHRPRTYRIRTDRGENLAPLRVQSTTPRGANDASGVQSTTPRGEAPAPDPSKIRPNDPSSDDPSGERGLKPVAVREMIGTLEGWLGPLAWDANVHDEIEWFAEEFAGQVVTVNAARKKCAELNLGRPFPYNLKKAMAAMKEPTAAVVVEKGLRDGGTTIQTPRDLELSNRAKAIVAADRPSAASEDRPVINWHVALEQARKELA